MRRQTVAVLWLVGLAGLAFALAVAAEAREADRPVVSSIKDLMEAIIDPSADVLWQAVGTVVDKDAGIQESVPRTDDDWRNVRSAAIRIIEGANLLMMPGRLAAPPGTKSDTPGVELEPPQISALIEKDRRSFNLLARELQALGVEAQRASETGNADLLFDVGGRMENVCEACHQSFWYPNAAAPPAGGQQSNPLR